MNAGEPLVRTLRLVALAAGLVLAGCFVDVSLSDSRLVCSDGDCPRGFECVEERCVPDGQGGADAGDPAADASDGPIVADGAPPADGAALPDAAPPDAAPLLSCDEQYGGAPAYDLCSEQADSCEFFLLVDPATPCSAHCAAIGGGACITAFNADNTDPTLACDRQKETGCDGANVSQICVCSRSAAAP
ncbi:MAG TPA: hypothetical protein VK698_31115 [Kofleriaceae bacterium]|nr:hypothetical protein [Kofleriaceae bacterium]